jgi:hypothetical protein
MDEYVRMVMKQGNGLPTVPVSLDPRNGDWLDTDIFEGEFYQDLNTGKVYTRDSSGIVNADGSPTKKVYKAIISQSGTGAPTEISVIQNEIGATVWSYVSTGRYRFELTGAFPNENKIFYLFQNNNATTTNGDLTIEYIDANQVHFLTFNNSSALTNGIITKGMLTIEIYD